MTPCHVGLRLCWGLGSDRNGVDRAARHGYTEGDGTDQGVLSAAEDARPRMGETAGRKPRQCPGDGPPERALRRRASPVAGGICSCQGRAAACYSGKASCRGVGVMVAGGVGRVGHRADGAGPVEPEARREEQREDIKGGYSSNNPPARLICSSTASRAVPPIVARCSTERSKSKTSYRSGPKAGERA